MVLAVSPRNGGGHLGGGDIFLFCVWIFSSRPDFGGEMLVQEGVQPHASEQSLEDGERSDRVSDECCAVVRVRGSSGGAVAGLRCWRGGWWLCGLGGLG